MSSPRVLRSSSRRSSIERDSEHISEDLVPQTVTEAAKMSGKGKTQDSAGKKREKIETRKKGHLNTSEEKVNSKSEETGEALALDDIINDFGDDELDDCESNDESAQTENEAHDEDSSNLVLELVEDSDEDVESEIAEEMTNSYQNDETKGNAHSLFKFA